MAHLGKLWAIGILIFASTVASSLSANNEITLELIGGTKDYPVARYKSETPDGKIVYGIWEFDCENEQFRNLARGHSEEMFEGGMPETEMQDAKNGTVERTGMSVICNLSRLAWAAKERT